MPGMNKLRWGIISTGNIALRFARALQKSATGQLVAVASRDLAKAEKFSVEFPRVIPCASYDDLLARPDIDAVYIATPHPSHAQWAIRAARAGKAILCEKPAAVAAYEVQAIIDVVRECGGFFLEAFMYRAHPQTARLVELIRSKTIGEVSLIECAFAFSARYNPASRLFNNALGGGGILDVGCYCVSMARLVAGAALGQDIAEPIAVKAVGHLDPAEGVDLHSNALFQFPGGITASLFTGVSLSHDNTVRIHGNEGTILVTQPWFAGREGAKIIVTKKDGTSEEIATETSDDLYGYEIDLVAKHRADGEAPAPAMSWADSLGNARALDSWRQEINVVYDAERYATRHEPIWGAPLQPRAGSTAPAATFPGLEKPMSRLVAGAISTTAAAGLIVLDDFFERGGNAFDTAFIYNSTDALLGHWMQSRGVREQCVVVAKGAHTPNCTPEALSRELAQSLDLLKTDYTDIYIMHRDNLDVPVGEFVNVLNEHRDAGRMRLFGGSNWSIPRLVEANEYAAKRGLAGFSVLNNQMSLASMISPVWKDCLSVSDDESMQWLRDNQFPLLAWSSQARGFFTARAGEDKRDDAELVRCWYSADNFERKRRAAILARQKGVEEINIALAYVLCQPIPVWTLVGPATIAETRSCFRALEISLSPEELDWLNLKRPELD